MGTVIDPVTFTSLLAVPGSWKGLHFFDMAGPSSMMGGILLEHAVTGITFEAVPGTDILKNSTIRLCEMFGIEQKYVDLVKKLLNFLLPGLGNVFEDNGQDQNKN